MNRHQETVVITGASAGVGRATTRRFAREGARIGLVARGLDRLEDTRREVEQLGGEALIIAGDVADPDTLENAAVLVEEQFGPIDVWINNAMASVFSPATRIRAAEYKRVTEVTYLGYVHGTLAALRRMQPRNRGTIVQVGSALAYRGIPLQAPYCAAKHAVQGFVDSLRCELLHERSGVHLTMVQLPAVNTPQFRWVRSRLPHGAQPVPPIYQPEVIAEAIHFAAHAKRREVWVGWPTVRAIIGNRVAPGYADHLLAESGYEAQQTAEPADPDRPDNLWEPVPGEQAARGEFSDRARNHSIQLWATMHRRPLVAGVTLIAAALLGATGLIRRAHA